MSGQKSLTVGLFTLNGYDNYGNRLQNYATQRTLERFGVQVDTVLIHRPTNTNAMARLTGISPVGVWKRAAGKLLRHLNPALLAKRRAAFVQFTTDHIRETEYRVPVDDIPADLGHRYDYYVCGSDQVWNPRSLCGSSVYFLTFAEKEKRISYAASFGITEIPQALQERYRVWLSDMHSISVRETAGARIVKELTGRTAEVHMDPTLMVSRSEWLAIAREAPCKPDGRYLLTYFLGNTTAHVHNKVKRLARSLNLRVVNLGDIRDKSMFVIGPDEFIDLVASASLVCTDSFHGAVFSVIMQTPFVVFRRQTSLPSIYSRLDTLLTTFRLSARKDESIDYDRAVLDFDCSHVPPILELEKRKALDYLERVFGGGDPGPEERGWS